MGAEDAAATSAYVGVGSNLDEPRRQVRNAIELLADIPDTHVAAVSSLYRSAPFGRVDQPDFVNAVVELRTTLKPRALFAELRAIESAVGRVRGERWGPRVIDLDLLAWGRAKVDETDLVIPHPGIAERNFVLLPLQEIAPEFEIPGLGKVGDQVVDLGRPRISRID